MVVLQLQMVVLQLQMVVLQLLVLFALPRPPLLLLVLALQQPTADAASHRQEHSELAKRTKETMATELTGMKFQPRLYDGTEVDDAPPLEAWQELVARIRQLYPGGSGRRARGLEVARSACTDGWWRLQSW